MCWNVQNVLVSWLVLEMTDSSFLLGMIMALTFAPRVLGVISGTITDRVDKRRLLMMVNSVQIVSSIFLGSLILGGEIQFWHIALIVVVNSTLTSFSMPAQQAYTVDLVGVGNTTNAISVINMSMFIAGMVGPSLVGMLVNLIGVGAFFYINALFFGVAATLVFGIKHYQSELPSRTILSSRSVLGDIIEGFRYSWLNKVVFGGQLVFVITNLFMWPCWLTLIPVFVRGVLQLDAAGLGWLTAANRLGGFVVSVTLASRDPQRKGRMLLLASLAWGGIWLVFSAISWFPISVAMLFAMGITSALTMTMASVVLLLYADSEVRGRVMGLQTLAITSQSPGNLIVGALAESVGVINAIIIEAIFFIGTMLTLMRLVPALRQAGDSKS
jgi:MFS family permease